MPLAAHPAGANQEDSVSNPTSHVESPREGGRQVPKFDTWMCHPCHIAAGVALALVLFRLAADQDWLSVWLILLGWALMFVAMFGGPVLWQALNKDAERH